MRDKDEPIEVPEPDPAADLRAAKERLGKWWLEDYTERSVYCTALGDDTFEVGLFTDRFTGAACVERGPTEAAALFAALEKVNA